jgi:hypothetical protein
MGFEGEYASYEPLRRIVSSEKLDAMRKRFVVREYHDDNPVSSLVLTPRQDLTPSATPPDLVLAFDGGYQPVPVKNGFPGAEVGYITIASVLLDLDKIKICGDCDIINPKQFRETEKATTTDGILPGCNVILDDCGSAKVSMRKALFETLRNERAFDNGETLLETYEALLKVKRDNHGDSDAPKSPLEDFDGTDVKLEYGYGEYRCSRTGKTLYSTDALRLHELMLPAGTNGEMYGQVMSTLEKLWFIHILRAFEKQKWLGTLKQVAFVLDGPLAVFSVSSWLVKVIEKEIQRINVLQKKITGEDLMIIGIEKSGTFANHFKEIDTLRSGNKGNFPLGTALLLDDPYIKKNIIFSDSQKPYGQDTYFGRKLFYKTKTGQRIVAVIACLDDKQKDLRTATPQQFTRLADTMDLLDNLVSCQYPNSLIPLISAHAEAAIPLNLGTRIFEELAREIPYESKDEKQ